MVAGVLLLLPLAITCMLHHVTQSIKLSAAGASAAAAAVLNCYGEGFQDLPATLCSGAPIDSQLGLWGPFALLNHACWCVQRMQVSYVPVVAI
jgi:hypothetical protein